VIFFGGKVMGLFDSMQCEKRIVDSAPSSSKEVVAVQVCQSNSMPFYSAAIDINGDFIFTTLD